MRTLYVVLILTILRSWGTVETAEWLIFYDNVQWGFTWDEVDKHIGIFAPKEESKDNSATLDGKISNSLETTENFFAEISGGLEVLALGTSLVPYLGSFVSIIKDFAGILSSETDWKENFSKAMSKEMKEEIVKDNIDNMDTTLRLIKIYIESINDTIQTKSFTKLNNDTMEDDARTIYKEFLELIIGFRKENSKFKHFPLLAAPILIEMGLLVSAFEPIQIALINETKLSCSFRDGIWDYIPFVVEDRLSKLENMNLIKLTELRNQQFIDWNPTALNDKTGTEMNYLDCNSEPCEEEACLIDHYSTKIYKNITEEKSECLSHYALHLRQLVEKQFPLKQLEKTCDLYRGEPTGD